MNYTAKFLVYDVLDWPLIDEDEVEYSTLSYLLVATAFKQFKEKDPSFVEDNKTTEIKLENDYFVVNTKPRS